MPKEDKMSPKNYLGDALTSISSNIIINISTVIVFFYTDVIGLPAAIVGTVMLFSSLVDAFTDIGMGVVVDKTRSKHGKARPWLIRMALPSLVCIVLLFAVPSGAGTGVKLGYAAVTNILLVAGVYTAISVPAGSLLSLETKHPQERANMGILRLVFSYIAGTLSYSLMIPIVNSLGGGRESWILVSIIYGLISALSLVVAFFLIKEKNVVELKEEPHPLKGAAHLLKNKYWLIALAVNVLIQVIYAMGVADTYYMKYIFGDENLVALGGLFRLAFVAVGFTLTGFFIKRFGKRNLMLIGTGISVFGLVLRLLNPYHQWLNFIAIGITTLGGVPALAAVGAMVADSIEYGEWKTGKRMVGLASSANSFAGKLGSAFFAGAAGWLLGLSGYDGTLTSQPSAAIQMIKVLNIHISLVCYALIFILMFFYKLDKDYGRIIEELELRRKAI